MERKDLEAVGAEYPHLRGLFLGPLGVVVIASGLGNLEWGPFSNLLVAPALFLAAALACLVIARFYQRNYGSVRVSRNAQIKGGVALAVCVPLLIGGSTMDHRLDLPVWGFLGSWAVLMLASYGFSVGLKLHHKVIWGAALVAGLLPIWGDLSPDLKSNLGLVVAGVGVILTGIFDHLLLMRTFDSAARYGVEA
ncbi:MAG TPA: hypothetical protein VFV09_07160 [Actinomycetota bacterium]|jgi:hypothetical protein|nr:hypothetical protein [Actinomycetota bacterium]